MRKKSILRSAVLLCVLLHGSISFGQETPVETANWPGNQSLWHGFGKYDFQVDGRDAYVIVPDTPAVGKPWVWRARFPGYHDEIDQILVQRGFHIGRINTDGMLGSPRAMKHWDAFYSFLMERGLSKQPALEGVSRGGLFVYNFASRWPDRVACSDPRLSGSLSHEGPI